MFIWVFNTVVTFKCFFPSKTLFACQPHTYIYDHFLCRCGSCWSEAVLGDQSAPFWEEEICVGSFWCQGWSSFTRRIQLFNPDWWGCGWDHERWGESLPLSCVKKLTGASGSGAHTKLLLNSSVFKNTVDCCDVSFWSWNSWRFILKIWTAAACALFCPCFLNASKPSWSVVSCQVCVCTSTRWWKVSLPWLPPRHSWVWVTATPELKSSLTWTG